MLRRITAGIVVCACAWVLTVLHASSVKEPVSPSTPNVSVPDGAMQKFRVVVILAGGDQLAGMLHMPFDTLTFRTAEKGRSLVRTEKLDTIKEIIFRRWCPRQRSEEKFLFFPCETEIVTAADTVFRCYDRISALDRFHLYSGEKKQYCYSYFYDYYKDGLWQNSGSPEKDFPQKNPHRKTVIKIIMTQGKTQNIIRDIIDLLK